MGEEGKKRPVGRPPRERLDSVPCKKSGCQKLAAPNQSYCCKDHAPYGRYGMENGGRGWHDSKTKRTLDEGIE